jgi:sigma-B regulation protein RsbU (phosphoserine phosphatase)
MKIEPSKAFKILVVDDNPDNIQVIGNFLRIQNYRVGYAMNGEQAIEILKYTNDYDLVLLDIDMPLMDGFSTCRIIRKEIALKDIPVIFITAFSEPEKILAGFDAGGNDYITKPFNSKELLARVNTHLQLKYKKDQVNELNQILEQYNHNLTDSIMYARHIQRALLPPLQILTEKIPDCFVLYKPKNIVSGDFYWFSEQKNSLYLAVADGTGHGVPGAFISILGLAILNEIVQENNISAPIVILEELKQKVICSLGQQNGQSESDDGMDIALCLINFETNTLQYAGAFRPLIIIRKNDTNGGHEILEIKGDGMPIGIYEPQEKRFTNHTIDLQPEDAFYLFSDGIASQFGGENERTFGSKRFKDLILNIQNNPMSLQGELMENAINEWKGDLTQTDDILVIGIKLDISLHQDKVWPDRNHAAVN